MALGLRSRGAGALLVVGLAASGCERGCLARWLDERGLGAAAPDGEGKARGLDLSGTDCSDGLLRCRDGRVEASRVAHVPHPCRGAGGSRACECPWDIVAACPSGCVSDGLEVAAAPSDAGTAQLCRPDAPVARPVLAGDPVPSEICAREGAACVDGIVRACQASGHPSRALAVCLHGCASHVGIGIEPGDAVSLEAIAELLCQRDRAERR